MTRVVIAFLATAPLAIGCGGGGGADAGCNNTCTPAGATQCSGSLIATCTADAKGCLSLSSPTACPSGKSCLASSNSCQPDPCQGVPAAGQCADMQTVQYCGTATGQGVPSVYSYACPAGEACSTDTGSAHCKATGACVPGATSCTDSTHVQTCVDGTPTTAPCSTSCLTTALGSGCTPDIATTSISFTVKYTARGPNASLTDWDTTSVDIAISNLLVLSLRGSNVIDARTTDTNGGVTILIPTTPESDDQVVLAATASDGVGGLAFIVADPGFTSPGGQQIDTVGTPRFWTWSVAANNLTDGALLTITEDIGSGALRVFDYLRYVYNNARNLEGGKSGLSLIVWLGYGTSWSCGSCFAPVPAAVGGLQFASQIWLDANTTDERWWSDPVTAHELGHWVMASYGTPPGEGGRHILGVPSLPGLDWSEGWATWHSSFARNSSVYYDKQDGTMFYIDIAADQYGPSGPPWQLPIAANGLLQLMDENEVSSILWKISTDASVGGAHLFGTLSGAHMNTSPWGRGYTRHLWDLDDQGTPINVVDTGAPAPCVADFLDALACGGVAGSVIDAATVPGTQYPYPSGSPICP